MTTPIAPTALVFNCNGRGYFGPCIHCNVSLVDAPDNHCPDCIYVDGISEPTACDCPR